MKNASSPFDRLLDAAADKLILLRAQEQKRRLSGPSFIACAMAQAEIDETRLREARGILDEADAAEAQSLIRRLAGQFRESTWPCPPPVDRFSKLVRVYGSEQSESQLGRLGLKPGEVIAIAAANSVERYGADAFGTIEGSYAEHLRAIQTLRSDLDALLETVTEAWSAADIQIEHETLTPTEREAGLHRIFFRRAPEVSPGRPSWAQRLIEIVAGERIANAPAKETAGKRYQGRRKIKRLRVVSETLNSPPGLGTA